MTSKHTPGPWLHRGKSDSVHTSCDTHPYGPYLFSFKEESAPTDEDLALILAAPELLELLERIVYHMEGGIRMEYPASPEESPQPASEWDHEADRLAGEARRLLARATGQ